MFETQKYHPWNCTSFISEVKKIILRVGFGIRSCTH
uniref:Uncharacterized protein n=1 Tax=Anguilla anguilla TaxID=7936 RepID=A0A0E9S268_ANGAN